MLLVLLLLGLLLAACGPDPISDGEHYMRGDTPVWEEGKIIGWIETTPDLTKCLVPIPTITFTTPTVTITPTLTFTATVTPSH